MMTLEEAIKHCKDVALSCTNKECALEHFQLLKWLQEYSNMLEKQGKQKSVDDLTQQEAMDIAVAKCFEQGEQKPVEPKFKVGDSIKTTNEEPLTITEITDSGYWSEDLFICSFDDAVNWELVEQNPVNKVESKFKAGDWVVSDYNNVACIESISETKYNLQCRDGYHEKISIEHIDRCWHLWTIQDAKPGDVLHATGWHSDCIFIFSGLDNWKFDEPDGEKALATSYCCIHVYSDMIEFGTQGPDCIEVNTVKPATKIQCDLLFRNIRENGYEWNAEEKELKKIEQKPVWGEEDDYNVQCLIAKVVSDIQKGNVGRNNELIDWLKSLKDRVGCEANYITMWKPSDEQLTELRKYSDNAILRNLYYNLKKLILEKLMKE